jgi:hypothetical protein
MSPKHFNLKYLRDLLIGTHWPQNAFCRLEDFRRIAARYDRLARNLLASSCLVAALA